MLWKIWYKGDLKIEGTTEAEWAAAPTEGVICVAARYGQDPYGIELGAVFSGSDWYWMYEGQLYQSGTSSDTPGEWLPSGAPDGAVLKRGEWTTNEEMNADEAEMMQWVTANG